MLINDLRTRLGRSGITATVKAVSSARMNQRRRWLTIASSHLGRSARLHAEVCRYVSASVFEARRQHCTLLVASGTAIEPWALHAAELFSVPVLRVNVGCASGLDRQDRTTSQIDISPSSDHGRDAVVVALADRVDCVFLRANGKIDRAIRRRLAVRPDASVRVAITDEAIAPKACRAAKSLMDLGAVGWHCGQGLGSKISGVALQHNPLAAAETSEQSRERNRWMQGDDWIVHCTRACDGPWPGQTPRQYRDELLLGDFASPSTAHRTALDSLCRIARQRRLVASAKASGHRCPVVCFSAVPLQRLLRRRTYRPHLHRWDYEPYGIAIRKDAAIDAGFRPVIYGDRSDAAVLAKEDRFRFQASGKTYDWTSEREWRSNGDVDLNRFAREDTRLFVPSADDARRLPEGFHISLVGDHSG